MKKYPGTQKKNYYGVEINGVPCGYLESTFAAVEKDGKKMKRVEQNIFFMITLLGSRVDTEMNMLYYADPGTGKCNYYSIDVKKCKKNRSTRLQAGHA